MKKIVLALIRWYQKFPTSLHTACRFTPTCSEYSYQAIDKYGILRGSWYSLKRIVRCHPFSRGGFDPVI